VLLRCTKKLLVVLGPRFVVESAAVADPQDWYANLVSFDGRQCLLLTQAATLFTIVAPDVRAPDLRSLQAFVVGLIERELAAENLPTETFGRLSDEALRIATTADRSVLGCMNDMASLLASSSPETEGSRTPTSARSIVRSGGTSPALVDTPVRSTLPSRVSADHHSDDHHSDTVCSSS
jgi:hypothetical protein